MASSPEHSSQIDAAAGRSRRADYLNAPPFEDASFRRLAGVRGKHDYVPFG